MEPPQRTSTLPRPLSKLPAPRSFASGIPKPPSPELAPSAAPPPAQQHASKRSSGSMSNSSSHQSGSSVTSFASSRPPTARKASNESNGVSTARHRLPLHPPQRPQSKQGSNQPLLASFSQEEHTAQAQIKAVRHPSQQENAMELWDSPDESDGSSSNNNYYNNTDTSPVRTLKKPPRPSLSDRTVDSLAHMSPTVNKRRSSFFNPDSPMTTPARQTSTTAALGSQSAMPKLNYGAIRRETGFAKPASPTKRPDSRIGIPSTPSQRTVSSGLPRSGLPGPGTATPSVTTRPTGHTRSQSAVKAPARPSSVVGMNTSPSKSIVGGKPAGAGSRYSMIVPPKTTLPGPASAAPRPMPQTRKQQPTALSRPKVPASTVAPLKRIDTVSREPVSEPNPSPKSSLASSAALRAQIAQAKASARKNNAKPNGPLDGVAPLGNNFSNYDDPFNQGLQQERSPLLKRIDAARRDGRLNIAALELEQIPDEVLQMYGAEAMEASSVAWNETVDLLRFNAADNEIREISDNVFPDKTIEELAQGEDAQGNQFGGIETLDLHGNLLSKVPMGLRRLDRLSSLNLARNKLDNQVFDVVLQISSLRELRLSDNELSRDVPEGINQLTNLEVLDLHNNKLSTLPKTVRDLVNLRTLNLSENRFSELPLGALFSLPNLLEFNVATNALTGAFFPGTVDIIRSLQTLDVSNNSLAALSFATDLHLPALQSINVSRNRIFAFPDVSSWTGLMSLLAEENGLTALPTGFASLKKLRNADFSSNSLRSLEAEVGAMAALETLNVASNPLREKRLLSMSTNEIKEELSKRLETTGH